MRSAEVQARYTDPVATDYSESSSRARYALALHFKPRTVASPRLLDLGCGDAGLLNYASRNDVPLSSYWGVDIRESILDVARLSSASFPTRFSTELPAEEEQFDLIVALGLVSYTITDSPDHDLVEYRRLFEEATRRLAPGGRIVFTLRRLDHDGTTPMLLPDPEAFARSIGVEPLHILTPFPEEYLLILQGP